MTRRGMLAVLAAALSTVLTACTTARSSAARPRRIAYGDDPSQFGELTVPGGASRAVVVVIHGGFWRSSYGLELGRPLAADLARRGYTAWNIEYRRVGSGGGVPETLDDVHRALERLHTVDGVDTKRLIVLGHSAGGHLAAWSAARARFARWTPARVVPTAVVSQAGVLDLVAARDAGLGGTAIPDFLAGHPADDTNDPAQQLPLEVPLVCVHGRDDDTVPLSQSADYVARATAAGADARLEEVSGGHFAVITITTSAWRTVVAAIDELAER